MLHLVLTLLLVGSSCGWADEKDMLRKRGETLVRQMCASCHAIGRDGQSGHVGAPPFRRLDRRLDLDTFAERLREGLTSSHDDMPMFRFTRNDARAVVAYLRYVQGL